MRIVNVDSVVPGWDTFLVQSRCEVHVIPAKDVIPHEHTDECACQPFIEPAEGEKIDGTYWLVHHSAWDGRV